MTAHRTLLAILVLGGPAACGHHDGKGDGGLTPELHITPETAMVTLAASGTGYAATQSFTVMLTDSDGKTSDVTSMIDWLVEDPNLKFEAGVVTVTAAGPYKLIAGYQGEMTTAQLTAVLTDKAVGTGFDPGDQGKLDGTPDAAQTPTIAYPLAGALFPVNVAPIEIHAHKSDPSQTLARIELTSGTLLSYKFYAKCAASPDPASFSNACIVSLGGGIATQLAGVSEAADVQLKIRLAAPDGSKLGESTTVALAWSKVALTGGLYYWTTAGANDRAFNTAIARYNFNGDASSPTIYLSSADAPMVSSGNPQCVGCHAVSPDGAKLSFSLSGSVAAFFSLYDVATTQPTVSRMNDPFAAMSTFSPDGSRIVTMTRGKLTLRTADSGLGIVQDNLFATDIPTEKLSHPFWSPSGGQFAFVSWIPSAADISANHNAGDMVQGGQIWIATANGTAMTSSPRLLVPRVDGITSYYPSISDDDQLVVFDRSSCSGPPNTAQNWGLGPCDGYNDISATLQVVPVAGGAPVPLTAANGGNAPLTTNSWPRWSPDHGTFRNKRLYWVAFSSRRTYGLALKGAQTDTVKPQLWFAAVAVDLGRPLATDPSFAPVWLPGQDPDLTAPRGNHTPVWTSKVVIFQ